VIGCIDCYGKEEEKKKKMEKPEPTRK